MFRRVRLGAVSSPPGLNNPRLGFAGGKCGTASERQYLVGNSVRRISWKTPLYNGGYPVVNQNPLHDRMFQATINYPPTPLQRPHPDIRASRVISSTNLPELTCISTNSQSVSCVNVTTRFITPHSSENDENEGLDYPGRPQGCGPGDRRPQPSRGGNSRQGMYSICQTA